MAKDRLKELKAAIGAQIRAFLEENEWSQQQLADALGADKSFISKLLSGEYNLTLKTIVELEKVIGSQIVSIITYSQK